MTDTHSPETAVAKTDEPVDPTVVAHPSITASRVQGQQTWSLERGEHELKVEDAAHKRRQEQVELDDRLSEARKDNEARREREKAVFWLVVVGIVLAFGFGVGLAALAADADTRQFGQALVLLIAGALAGYVTGSRAGK